MSTKGLNQRDVSPCRGARIPALDPDPEYDFQPFGDSGSRFGSSKKWNRNTSSCHQFRTLPPPLPASGAHGFRGS